MARSLASIPRLGSRLANHHQLLRRPGESIRRFLGGPPVIALPLVGITFYVLNDPTLVEEVVVRQHTRLHKDRMTRRLREFLGDGLLTGDGDPWRRHRRLIQPAFHRRRIAGYAAVMARLADETFATWGPGIREIHHDLAGLTLRIVGETLFGSAMEHATQAVGEALELAMGRYAGEHFGGFLPLWVPTPHNRRIVAAIARVDAILGQQIVDRRRRGIGDADDLLGILLAAQDDDGSRLSDRQLRDECMTLFLAGHETTALAISYTLYLLATHPAIQEATVAAIDAALGGRLPTITDLPRLVAVERVIKESMRLYPPAWSIGREAIDTVEVGPHRLPRGAQIGVFPWALHRDPRYFREPEVFDPGRWEDATERPKFAYMPFGAGPRICIGNTFAMTESILVVTRFLQRFTVTAVDRQPPRLLYSITLRPRDGIRLALQLRS